MNDNEFNPNGFEPEHETPQAIPSAEQESAAPQMQGAQEQPFEQPAQEQPLEQPAVYQQNSAYYNSQQEPPAPKPYYVPPQMQQMPPPPQPYQNPYYNSAPVPAAPAVKKGGNGLKLLCVILAICLCISGVVAGVAIATRGNEGGKASGDPNAPTMALNDTPDTTNAPASASGTLSAEQVAEKVKPSVVGIVVYAGIGNQIGGEGSGIIMGEDTTKTYTYIITCAHVVSGSNSGIFVQLESGKQYKADIVGLDKRTDLGVLRIKEKGLKQAEFGKSDALKVGSAVYAVGNPGGMKFFGSFTNGVVSAIGRDVGSQSGYNMECIQHNAAISPGNSGGALVNEFGQVVGINSMKIMAEEYEGMGFAIPTKDAMTIVNKLIQFSYVPDRTKLGIVYYPVSASQQYSMVVQANKLPAGSLIIDSITQDSNLNKTDAQKNDMIIAVNGKNMDDPDLLADTIEKSKVGDVLTLTLCRVNVNYEIKKFDVKVALVEDKGDQEDPATTTEPDILDPFS